MKVLKFGGTSVGSPESILNLKSIVERERESVIVVVSALGGVTDKLLATAALAAAGDEGYAAEMQAIVERHHKMIADVIADTTARECLTMEVSDLLEQLRTIYYGVYLVKDLSAKSKAAIVSYGEQLSSRIVATLIKGARRVDSREFVKTELKYGKHVLDSELTNTLVRERFGDLLAETQQKRTIVAPGFISSDRQSGETTNLGRGGSDYTAAIIAAALDADVLEIWTDVDGFMTADPRVIPTAYTISSLSYNEAMELCNFGAKVIYPPTIYPVCVKNIPIKVKNTFHPDAEGTTITATTSRDSRAIKGISSIKGVALITVAGLSMVGVIGVNRRIFGALTANGISVFMVSQASSETSTSLGVPEADADKAVEVLNDEFAKEIATGSMFPMRAEKGLATIAIVGENMKQTPGIAGKLFGTLGRSGISVISCCQGASETNISFVVEERYLRKSLNVIHDSFFLSEYKELNLFICGVGTVGGNLIEQIRKQHDKLMATQRLKLNVVGIASSHNAVFRRGGLPLDNYKELLAASEPSNTAKLRDEVLGMNIFNSVFVDCTASAEVAGIYQKLLENNVSVVAANKVAASGDYATYASLKLTAMRRGVKFLYETNVGAGLPVISTINDLRNSGDKVLKIEAVLSGTLNFIFSTLSKDVTMSRAVAMARERGYSEPDPRVDLSGKDVVRKLVILTREAGYKIGQDDVRKQPFLPAELFDGTVEQFWQQLPSLDAHFETLRAEAEAAGKKLRFVATMEHGEARVALEQVARPHPFYGLEGSNNILLITTDRYHEYPMLIQGYGAGASVTAAGVFANIMSIANI